MLVYLSVPLFVCLRLIELGCFCLGFVFLFCFLHRSKCWRQGSSNTLLQTQILRKLVYSSVPLFVCLRLIELGCFCWGGGGVYIEINAGDKAALTPYCKLRFYERCTSSFTSYYQQCNAPLQTQILRKMYKLLH